MERLSLYEASAFVDNAETSEAEPDPHAEGGRGAEFVGGSATKRRPDDLLTQGAPHSSARAVDIDDIAPQHGFSSSGTALERGIAGGPDLSEVANSAMPKSYLVVPATGVEVGELSDTPNKFGEFSDLTAAAPSLSFVCNSGAAPSAESEYRDYLHEGEYTQRSALIRANKLDSTSPDLELERNDVAENAIGAHRAAGLIANKVESPEETSKSYRPDQPGLLFRFEAAGGIAVTSSGELHSNEAIVRVPTSNAISRSAVRQGDAELYGAGSRVGAGLGDILPISANSFADVSRHDIRAGIVGRIRRSFGVEQISSIGASLEAPSASARDDTYVQELSMRMGGTDEDAEGQRSVGVFANVKNSTGLNAVAGNYRMAGDLTYWSIYNQPQEIGSSEKTAWPAVGLHTGDAIDPAQQHNDCRSFLGDGLKNSRLSGSPAGGEVRVSHSQPISEIVSLDKQQVSAGVGPTELVASDLQADLLFESALNSNENNSSMSDLSTGEAQNTSENISDAALLRGAVFGGGVQRIGNIDGDISFGEIDIHDKVHPYSLHGVAYKARPPYSAFLAQHFANAFYGLESSAFDNGVGPVSPLGEGAQVALSTISDDLGGAFSLSDNRNHIVSSLSPNALSGSSHLGEAKGETPAQQIAIAIRKTEGLGIELRLHPEELGMVRILMRQEGELLRVLILAERGETFDLLRRGSAELQDALLMEGHGNTSFSFQRPDGQKDPARQPSGDDQASELRAIDISENSRRVAHGRLDLRL